MTKLNEVLISFDKGDISKKTGKVALRFWVQVNGKSIPIPARETVLAKYWIADEQIVSRRHDFHYRINENLKNRREAIERIILDIPIKTKVDTKYFLAILEPVAIVTPTVTKKQTFFSYVKYLKEVKLAKILKPDTLRQFDQVIGHLEAFDSNIDFEDFDNDFYEEYLSYLLAEAINRNTKQPGLQDGTITRHFIQIRKWLGFARKDGIKVSNDFEDYQYSCMRYKPFYLNWSEVDVIYKFQPDTATKEEIRDIWVLMAQFGLRDSDKGVVNRVNVVEQGGKKYLRFNSPKSQKDLLLFISPIAKEILEKYDYQVPDYDPRVVNRWIKIIAADAGINGELERVRYSGPNRVVAIKTRANFISTHTARRTFARRWWEAGGNILLLSRFLGHTDIKTTLQYIGVEDDEINAEMERIIKIGVGGEVTAPELV